MYISKNKPCGRNRFYNIQKNDTSGCFFVLPTITVTNKKIADWGTEMQGFFFGFLKWCVQINIFKENFNKSLVADKALLNDLLKILRENGLGMAFGVKSMQDTIDFLEKNKHIIVTLKNANIDHPYIKAVICQTFSAQPFITERH